MTDLHALTLQALGIRVIRDRVAEADERNRQALREAMQVGDRKTAQLPRGFTPDTLDYIPVGAVTYAKGITSARVVDPGALLHWVKQNRPGEIVESVRGSYLSAVLTAAKRAGLAVDEHGEVIPGIEIFQGDPIVKVVPEKSPEADAAMVAALFTDSARVVRSLLTEGDQ